MIAEGFLRGITKTAMPEFSTLKKNQVPLTPEERAEVLRRGAVWYRGSDGGKPSSAVSKAVVNGKTWYWCSTHRAWRGSPTLKGAIGHFKFIKTTA